MKNTFQKLLAPLKSYLESEGKKIDAKTDSRKLFVADFTTVLLYGFLTRIRSLRQLVTDLETNPKAVELGLAALPFSTLKDGFTRFPAGFFRDMHHHLAGSLDFLKVDGVDEHGEFRLVDGSLFPTIISMCWAQYKKTKNAIRLHMSMDLNRMVPVEFVAKEGNSSERDFLRGIVERAVTYIADRGYFSFSLASGIDAAGAFFIMRIKDNILFEVTERLSVSTREGKVFPKCFRNVSDGLARFTNDPSGKVYRIIEFDVQHSHFTICTNRMDLTTLEVIILYAMRWQVELLFKFIKRTMNGIHLFNLSPNGVNICFHLLMIAAMLKLAIRQESVLTYRKVEREKEGKSGTAAKKAVSLEDFSVHEGHSPDKWIENLTEELKDCWKIGVHWMVKLSNLLTQPFDSKVIMLLGKGSQ